jgi:hypothetical protein
MRFSISTIALCLASFAAAVPAADAQTQLKTLAVQPSVKCVVGKTCKPDVCVNGQRYTPNYDYPSCN